MTEAESIHFDPRVADANYKQFPSFADWAATPVDEARWSRATESLERYKDAPEQVLEQARQVAMRAAAVETGAIEGLYELDRGFTITVAVQAAGWEAVFGQQKQEMRSLIKSQLSAYDYILDLATEATPLTEAWIRELHHKLCEGQDYYLALTEAGLQKQKLPLGEYKKLPNHVRTAAGKIHSHAPVDLTPEEMHRLKTELTSTPFLESHPVLQAAYAHYALTVVHPFADGNGRVARALASIYSYRAASVPVLIFSDKRTEYLDALEAADNGDPKPFSHFMLFRILDAMQLVEESLRGAEAPSLSDVTSSIAELYITRGGFAHADVDEAAYKLAELFNNELNKQIEPMSLPEKVTIGATIHKPNYQVKDAGFRPPVQSAGRLIRIVCTSPPPANAQRQRDFRLLVPSDAGVDDVVRLQDVTGDAPFDARVDELAPNVSTALLVRLEIATGRILREELSQLRVEAEKDLRSSGL